jgi:hypothetical protein
MTLGGLVGLFAFGADFAAEPLREHHIEGRPDEVPLDAHVDQAGDGAAGVVRVQRAEDEMPRESGLDRDAGRFLVADLADHDDVGVLTQQTSQHGRERQADFFLHLELVDGGQLKLDRVFDRADVFFDRADRVEGRIQGRALAASGRAGDEGDSVRQPEL